MRQPITISHKLHPSRQGKSLAGMAVVKHCLASNRSLVIGTNDVDTLYDRIKLEYPEVKLSKGKDCVIVGKGEE